MSRILTLGNIAAAPLPLSANGLRSAVIAALFGNDEQGAFYDPSDLSTLLQDSAGTTPVTADGQPVGLMLDLSGNDNHATQETTSAKPLHKVDGISFARSDGFDDNMIIPSIGDATEWTLVAGIRIPALQAGAYLVDFNSGRLIAGLRLSTGHIALFDGAWRSTGEDPPLEQWVVLTYQAGDGSVKFRINGTEIGLQDYTPKAAQGPARLFSHNNGLSTHFEADHASLVMFEGVDANKLELAEQWTAKNIGVTL
jgi:hypothetical protein